MKGKGYIWLLGLIVVSAVVVFAAAVRMAREERTLRVEQDREPLTFLGSELQRELAQLERLYESHLRRFAREAPRGDEFEVRTRGEAISGVRQFSLVRREKAGQRDWHVDVTPERSGEPPLPTFDEAAEAPWPGQEMELLDEGRIFQVFGDETGWVDEPGQPLFYWARRDADSAALLLIDRAVVARSMNDWVREWADTWDGLGQRRAAANAGGSAKLEGPEGHLVMGWGEWDEGAPHLLLPVRSRFGSWRIAGWDRVETVVSYSMPMLVGGALLAVMLAGGGFVAVWRQRAAMREAEQRVSFVNQVSHELRTPLTNIMLNSDLAAETETPAGERRRRLELIRDEAGRLSRMIGNVLSFARGERGQLELQPVRCVPEEVVTEVLEAFGTSLARHSIEVTRKGSASEEVRIDRDALGQVLSNLVSNVEKYAASGGVLEVESRQEGGEVEIVVRDRGPGIPAGAEEKIFRPFQRLGSSVREGVSGAGLGLAIARDLAERMGGTLSCEAGAEGGEGGMFRLRVPAPVEPGNVVRMKTGSGG